MGSPDCGILKGHWSSERGARNCRGLPDSFGFARLGHNAAEPEREELGPGGRVWGWNPPMGGLYEPAKGKQTRASPTLRGGSGLKLDCMPCRARRAGTRVRFPRAFSGNESAKTGLRARAERDGCVFANLSGLECGCVFLDEEGSRARKRIGQVADLRAGRRGALRTAWATGAPDPEVRPGWWPAGGGGWRRATHSGGRSAEGPGRERGGRSSSSSEAQPECPCGAAPRRSRQDGEARAERSGPAMHPAGSRGWGRCIVGRGVERQPCLLPSPAVW